MKGLLHEDDDMTYCVPKSCPFLNDCRRSVKALGGRVGFFTFADFSPMCERRNGPAMGRSERGDDD